MKFLKFYIKNHLNNYQTIYNLKKDNNFSANTKSKEMKIYIILFYNKIFSFNLNK